MLEGSRRAAAGRDRRPTNSGERPHSPGALALKPRPFRHGSADTRPLSQSDRQLQARSRTRPDGGQRQDPTFGLRVQCHKTPEQGPPFAPSLPLSAVRSQRTQTRDRSGHRMRRHDPGTASAAAQTMSMQQRLSHYIEKRFGMFIHYNMNTYLRFPNPAWAENRVDPKTFAPPDGIATPSRTNGPRRRSQPE